MRKPKLLQRLLVAAALLGVVPLSAQGTFPENGVADSRQGHYAFTNATIFKDATTKITNGTLVIKDGKITAVGAGIKVPAGAVEINCEGKFIYPSFIDIYSDYGISAAAAPAGPGGGGFGTQPQLNSTEKGPMGWNQALKSDVDAYRQFTIDDAKAKPLREAGFGAVLSHVKDGIARGTGTVATLATTKENFVIIKDRATAHYSFSKGSSRQSYPSSMMGTIALLRQTFLDAQWYKSKPAKEGLNLTLQAWNDNLSLPQIFEANDKWNSVRADRIGDEFGVQFIIKAGQNEYQRIKEMKATNASFILPLNFPAAMDVEDPAEARFVALTDMKHWEMAPAHAAAFEKAGVPFCLTTADLRSAGLFWPNLRKAMEYGLSETKAFEALTKIPAQLLGVYDKVGSLDNGKLANFLITSGPIFNEKTSILYNWVQGIKYSVKDDVSEFAGLYDVVVTTPAGKEKYKLDITNGSTATLIGTDTMQVRFTHDGKQVKLNYAPAAKRGSRGPAGAGRGGASSALPATAVRLVGMQNGSTLNGTGVDSLGNTLTWVANFVKAAAPKLDSTAKKPVPEIGKVTYPFLPFG